MDVKNAWEIVKKNNPGMKPFTCNEGRDHYIFSLVPNNLAKNDCFANGAVYMVDKKTGEYKEGPWTIALNEPLVKVLDVSIFK